MPTQTKHALFDCLNPGIVGSSPTLGTYAYIYFSVLILSCIRRGLVVNQSSNQGVPVTFPRNSVLEVNPDLKQAVKVKELEK
jgi:hypothetical protein